MIKISKQRILESKLTIGEKARILEKLVEFEAGLEDIMKIEMTEFEFYFNTEKKK